MIRLKPGDLIAWDVDDVLFPFTDPFLIKFGNAELGTQFILDDFHSPYLSIVCPPDADGSGCTKDREFKVVDAIYGSDEYHEAEPMEGALDVLDELRTQFLHVAMTARTPAIAHRTYASIQRHFPGRFEDVHFMSKKGRPDYLGTKPELCQQVGAKVLIDDTVHNLEGCAEHGIAGVLVSRRWNVDTPETPDFKRVNHIREIPELVRTMTI